MSISIGGIEFPIALALSVVALVGYVAGLLRGKKKASANENIAKRMQNELGRAQTAINQLEDVIRTTRSSLDEHQGCLKRLKARVGRLKDQQDDATWQELCREVEGILDPTLRLAAQIAHAHELLRYQSSYLMSFSEMRTDPLTGANNRRALEDMLNSQFAMFARYDSPFAILVIDVDYFKRINDTQGHLPGDQMLRDLAKLLLAEVREVDTVARYGGDEFVVLLPQTDLDGALVSSERLRAKIDEHMPLTVSVGAAAARHSDTPETLFCRADAALYRAKTAGRNRVCAEEASEAAVIPQESAAEDATMHQVGNSSGN